MSLDYSGSYAGPRLDLGVALEEHGFNFNGIARSILSPIDVTRQQASFSAFPRASTLQRADVRASERGEFNRISTSAKDKDYACVERGLEGQVFDRERKNYANDFDADYQVAGTVRRALAQEQEIRVKDLLFNETTFAATFADNSVSDPWADPDADIIGQLLDAQEESRALTGEEPTTLVLGKKQLIKMLKNNGIKARFPGNPLITRQLLEQALPMIFGLDQMLVGTEVYNAADEGQTVSVTDIWGSTHVALVKPVPQGAGLQMSGLGRIYAWRDNGGLFVVEQYREDKTRSNIIRVREDVDEKVQDAAYCALIKTG
jgi:hypothetical protein